MRSNTKTGEVRSSLWEYSTGRELVNGPLAVTDEQIVCRGTLGTTFVLSARGEEMARLESGRLASSSEVSGFPFALGFDLMFLADEHTVRCLDTMAFDPLWEIALLVPTHTIVLSRGRILAVAGDELICLGAD